MNQTKKIINILLICIFCIFIFILGPINAGNNEEKINNNTEISSVLLDNGTVKKTESSKKYKKTINKNSQNKIIIPGTNINNSLVQGTDNDYYLNHSSTGDKDKKGSIFIDYRNTAADRKILIYGHNSKTLKSALFHDLEKYLKQDFYKNYQDIELIIDNEKSLWKIFSVMIVEESNNTHMKITFNDKEWIKHLNWIKDNSIYDTGVNIDVSNRIIMLQTCYYNPENSYLIISAKKIK